MTVTFVESPEKMERKLSGVRGGFMRYASLYFLHRSALNNYLQFTILTYISCSLKYRKFKSEDDLTHIGDEIDPSRRGDLSQAFDDFIVESEQERAGLGTDSIL